MTVAVDGVDCTVKTIETNEITCETSSTTAASSSGLYAGANGIRMKVYNSSYGYSLTTMQTLSYYEHLALHLESFQNQGTYFGRVFQGYFKAPATTNYKFYISCDDSCEAFLSTNSDPANMVSIASTDYYTSFRNYYTYTTQQSSWVALTENTYYYIEV